MSRGLGDVYKRQVKALITITLTPTTIPATISLFGILNSLRSCTAATITNTSAIMTDIISGTYPPPQKNMYRITIYCLYF